jgi:hypothetical protein
MGKEKNEPSVIDDRRFDNLRTKQRLGVPISKEDAAWVESFKERKTMAGVLGAEARGEAYGKNRPLRVIDLKTFRPQYKTMRDM